MRKMTQWNIKPAVGRVERLEPTLWPPPLRILSPSTPLKTDLICLQLCSCDAKAAGPIHR